MKEQATKKKEEKKVGSTVFHNSRSRRLESASLSLLSPAPLPVFFFFFELGTRAKFLTTVGAGGGREKRMDPFLAQLALAAAGAQQQQQQREDAAADDRQRGGGGVSGELTRRRGGPPSAPFRGNADNAKTRICLR